MEPRFKNRRGVWGDRHGPPSLLPTRLDSSGTITAIDSQTLDGHFDIQRVAAEGPKHMTMQISGKWLDAACTAKDGDE